MFENIIGQENVTESLRNACSRKELPSSLLFHGPDYSGKLSTALELARGLTCRGNAGAPWNCGCPSCAQHRLLIHPYTLMAGGRYFQDEIDASAAAFRRNGQTATRYLFVRSVRKLLRRYDPVFWEAKDPGLKKVQGTLAELEERISLFHPDSGTDLSGKALEKEIAKILELSAAAAGNRTVDNISIDQIRRISVWAQETSDSPKVIILENADRMLESARNALLKILEEPPARVTFILLTGRKGGIMPTILSRVRPYLFAPRNEEESGQVLTRIFREESGEYRDLREFFLAWNVNLEKIRKGVHLFLEGLENREPLNRENLEELFGKAQEGRKPFRIFLQEIQTVFARKYPPEVLAADPVLAERLGRWSALFREALSGCELYNQSPALLAEGLYYAMRGNS